jgi:FixJ family two-component response regulator
MRLDEHVPMKEHRAKEGIVFVVDPDASCRAGLNELFLSVGLEVKLYASGRAFLDDGIPDDASCVVLDVTFPETSGLEIQEEMARAGIDTPIIFVTGHGDVQMAVRAMKAGAADFLTKPFRSQELLDAVFTAVQEHKGRRHTQQSRSTLRERFESLTPREREIVTWVAAGDLNKQIAAKLGLSEVTVKVHRAKAMRKMGANSLADLVRMIARCSN